MGVICTGPPDNHCCWINGVECEFLDKSGPMVRCAIYDQMPTPEWEAAPVGRWFAEGYPGYTCRDWPQNIPEVIANGHGLCCWSSA